MTMFGGGQIHLRVRMRPAKVSSITVADFRFHRLSELGVGHIFTPQLTIPERPRNSVTEQFVILKVRYSPVSRGSS